MDFIKLTSDNMYSTVYVSAMEISHFIGHSDGSTIYLKRDDKFIRVKETPEKIYKALEEQEDARFNVIFGCDDQQSDKVGS